ncbi:acyl-coenzyme A amino acid N-acyltransferase 1-like [Babylonia areolata]|uniref:acyl-coenzyme A amino acid N-acyltransferase 1-like n=1 Tax=Babylonia areolata TaxID=304850 RepID=UPI003FD42AA6
MPELPVAANGDTSGEFPANCIHTHPFHRLHPWWEVDLGRTYPVYNMDVRARGGSSACSRKQSTMLQRISVQHPTHHLHVSSQPDPIQVTPKVSLFDQKVHIKVQGLPTKAKVTLHATTQAQWHRQPVTFTSCGHYVSSEEGVDPMGPFWSLSPCPSGPQNVRMVVKNGEDPVLYTLSLYLGHWSVEDLVVNETTQKPLYSTTVTRLKKSADVRRIPVKEGGVRGVMFLPPGDGRHPGVIDMTGSTGGLSEIRAALLASHGFAVLALPYFRFQDLPAKLEDVPFDYFEEAVSWFSSHTAVKDGGIGVVGNSKGGEYSMLMAWLCPQVWESSAHVLMLVSDDDQVVNVELADVCHSMYPEDKRHLMEVVHYPGAGHLLEPPYSPHCSFCFHPTWKLDIRWGGNPTDHVAAQEDSWKRILAFLKTHLS